jgi:hypothetical protein
MCLLETHDDEADHDANPVQVIGDYRAISSGVCPAKDSIEDTPAVLDSFGGGTALKSG